MFVKGKSGNPGGRPKGTEEFRTKCRKLTGQALAALERALDDPDNYVQASKILLEFGWGKPSQPVEHAGDFSFVLKTNVKGD